MLIQVQYLLLVFCLTICLHVNLYACKLVLKLINMRFCLIPNLWLQGLLSDNSGPSFNTTCTLIKALFRHVVQPCCDSNTVESFLLVRHLISCTLWVGQSMNFRSQPNIYLSIFVCYLKIHELKCPRTCPSLSNHEIVCPQN